MKSGGYVKKVCVAWLLSLAVGQVVMAEEVVHEKNQAVEHDDNKAAEKDKVDAAPRIFAKVGDVAITVDDFEIEMTVAARKKFYHGRAPEGEFAQLQRDVGDKLVANILLLKEAKRRAIQPDAKLVEERIKEIEERNRAIGGWEEKREKYLPTIKQRLEAESMLAKLELEVRKVATPSEEQVLAYYKKFPEKFTEPLQMRVSLILLHVDPGAPGAQWMAAYEKAKEISKQLKEGADFAKLAKENPGDKASAEFGGDMGYLHAGMLPAVAEEVLKNTKVGEITDPIRLLEGVAVFKLTDRNDAKLSTFDVVKGRASDLWVKDEAERAWTQLIADLKKAAVITVDESHYAPLPPKEDVVVSESK